MMLNITLFGKVRIDDLGMVPWFLAPDDPRPAKEQFDERYVHGGGWRPINGFKLLEGLRLKYPGDPVLEPIAAWELRDEKIVMYPHAIVAIYQPDGTFEVARMD